MFRLHRAPWLRPIQAVLTALALLAGSLLVVVATAPAASADTYTPPAGVRMNYPRGNWLDRNNIRRHVLRSIYSVPAGGTIRIMSWNIRDRGITKALVGVHRYKGVTVQVLMQDDNAYEHEQDASNPIAAPGAANPRWWWMKRQLRQYGNHLRVPDRQSWARLCDASCRGGSGIAHIKMMIFSQVHTTPMVVMYGSGNLTAAAANIQWNDLQTVTGDRALFNFAHSRFTELAQDRRLANPVATAGTGAVRMTTFPWYGAGAVGDPVLNALGPVRCIGATPGFGTARGRTIIRVSQTAIGDRRGRQVARRLGALKRAGCNVKVLYGLMGPRVKRILRNHRVPIRQLAVDLDGDWVYDRYLHHKVLTISGAYGASPAATLALNGSANIQGYTLRSDEILGQVTDPASVWFYQRWIDRRFPRPRTTRDGRVAAGSTVMASRADDVDEAAARRAGIDPYAKFEVN